MTDKQKEILIKWYGALDLDYGEHGNDSDGYCPVCEEAYQLGLIEGGQEEE